MCQRHLAARVAALDSPAGSGGRTDDVELLMPRAARRGEAGNGAGGQLLDLVGCPYGVIAGLNAR